jgi:hypothetical protein
MILLRFILIVSVILFAYSLVLAAIFIPCGWVAPIAIGTLFIRKKSKSLHAHGTARWAESTELGGMIDE